MPRGRVVVMAASKSLSVMEHLEELRAGLLRSLVYVTVGTSVSWAFRNELMRWLEYPAREGARRAGLADFSFHIFEPAGGIMMMIQVAVLGGVVLAFAGIAYEVWKFVRPALTPGEQRYVYLVLPAAVLLFAAGIWFCYIVTPRAFGFLIVFNTQLGVEPQFILGSYLRFFTRLLLVFGLAFETPLVMWFLARIGLVSSAAMRRSWRWAVVVIMVIAAMVTPTPDPFNMLLLAGPMMGLYFLSLGLILLVEMPRRRDKRKAIDIGAHLETPEEPAETEADPESDARADDNDTGSEN